MALSEEMSQWLSANQETYEFTLLHAIYNDTVRRMSLLAIPLEPQDFSNDSHLILLAAIKTANKISGIMGAVLPTSINLQFMESYIRAAARAEEMDEEAIAEACIVMQRLENQEHTSQWYFLDPYLEAWLMSIRGKRYARKVQMAPIADMSAMLTLVQRDIASVSSALAAGEDEMDEAMDGTSTVIPDRRKTGIEGLDICLNGGWGAGECYLLFAGSGGGKSICAAQCAWFEALNKGYSLIVSTELRAREYIARIVSNACSIDIGVVQDCENFTQIRQAVAMRPGLLNKMNLLEKTLQIIRERVCIKKVNNDDGSDARGMLEREREKFKSKYGVYPTWICLDWLGSMADVAGGAGGTSERAMAWEYSANGCVKFADATNTPVLVLAQAVNDAQKKHILLLGDIGISKGIGKNMVLVVGITNTIDEAAIKAAILGKSDMPPSANPEQFFCVCKARKGEGNNIRVTRRFGYQRFEQDMRDKTK